MAVNIMHTATRGSDKELLLDGQTRVDGEEQPSAADSGVLSDGAVGDESETESDEKRFCFCEPLSNQLVCRPDVG